MRLLLLLTALIFVVSCKKDEGPDPEPLEVKYYVSCEDCSIDYIKDGGGTTTVNTNSGSGYLYETMSPGATYGIVVHNNRNQGSLIVRVYINGVVVDQRIATGPFVEIRISGLVPSATPHRPSGEPDNDSGSSSCGYYNGKTVYTGPRGGCYYINKNGNKTYVDRAYCNCN